MYVQVKIIESFGFHLLNSTLKRVDMQTYILFLFIKLKLIHTQWHSNCKKHMFLPVIICIYAFLCASQ